jgi:hypothetical protein
MKKTTLSIFGILAMTVGLWATVPYTFTANTPAKASEVNSNFQSLSNKITTLEGDVSNIVSGGSNGDNYDPYDGTYHVSAQVNGVDMTVITDYNYNYYKIETPTKEYININHNGTTSNILYYASEDCTGQPYFNFEYDTDNITTGTTYLNPKLQSHVKIAYAGTNLFYDSKNNFVKLYYQSHTDYDYKGGCVKNNGAKIVSEALPNNPAITGISGYPLHITGVGSPITVIGEVGDPANQTYGKFKVYAAGVKIGYTNSKPDYGDEYIRVYLDTNPITSTSVYKDGTYSGGVSSKIFYYPSTDCTGNAYAEVLKEYDTLWWSSNSTNEGYIVTNADNYFRLGDTIYKMSNGYQSTSRSYDGYCSNTSSNSYKNGYRLATQISNPNPDSFATPITIEGYEEEVQYDALGEAQ